MREFKNNKPHLKVGVVGCIASYKKKEIKRRFDFVNFIFGAKEEFSLLQEFLSNVVLEIEAAKIFTGSCVLENKRRLQLPKKLDLRLGGLKLGDLGFKVSAVVFRGEDWHHYNSDEFEGHDPAFIGRPHLRHNGVDEGGVSGEFGNPDFTEDMLPYWPGSDLSFVGRRFIDGIDGIFPDGETDSPIITEDMVATAASDPFHRYTLENGIALWGVTDDKIGKKYFEKKIGFFLKRLPVLYSEIF
jgi:hypothetical protein